MKDPKRVSRRTLLAAWIRWLFFSHATYNYERLQGLGFAHAMVPVIRKLYDTREEIAEALKRHLAFFNTEAQVGAMIPAMIIAMEEERASGHKVTEEAMTALKSGLMGVLSGVGDSVTQGVITPILLSLGISLASAGNLAGPILYFILESGAIISISYLSWTQGYRMGRSAVKGVLAGGAMRRWTEAAGVLGMVVVGALAAQLVSLSTVATVAVGQEEVNLQTDLLDEIMVGLLPLLLTLGLWWMLAQGISALTMIGLLFVLGIDGVLLGWLGWTPVVIGWENVLALSLTVSIWYVILAKTLKHRLWWWVGLLLAKGILLVLWGRLDLTILVGPVLLLWTLWTHYGPRASTGVEGSEQQ
jgi:PTS system mannose-specific IID component